MKKYFTLVAAIAIAGGFSASASYVTQGDKSLYTFESLSQIEGSGVTKVGDAYHETDDIEIAATDTLRISDNATVLLGNNVQIKALGYTDFRAANKATISRIGDTDEPKGIYVFGEDAVALFDHITMQYCGIRSYGNVTGIIVNKCRFYNYNSAMTSSGCITLGSASSGNAITDSHFFSSTTAAIGGAANGPAGVTVSGCYFGKCNTEKSNRPVINLTVGGDNEVIIENNYISGNKNTKVGGIGVGNMLSLAGTNRVVIKNNTVENCRYGLTTIGPMNVTIEGNELINNRYETNAMNGGSGMSLYDTTGKQTAVIKGNHIEGSLWGITVIGCGEVNIGKTDDPNADDYNPGENVFVNNGNGGTLYDLYNNSANTIYAQGNMWNVNEQTAEEIAKVITDKSDINSLGEVIYSNPKVCNVLAAPRELTTTVSFDKVKLSWKAPTDPIELKWHDGEDYNGYDGIHKDPQGAVEMIIGARFTADDLKGYANKVIEAIDYFEYRDFIEAYAQIYENGKLVRNQKIDLTGFEKNSWRSTVLDEPYIVSENSEVIVGVKYRAGYNQNFCAITDRYATAGKGNIVSHDNGKTWNAEGPGDFLITAHLRNIANVKPDKYVLYDDNNIISMHEITDGTEYTIEGNSDGEHTYTLYAYYGDNFRGVSATATTKAVTSYMPAPATLTGAVESGLTGTITWQAPLKRNDAELSWSNKEFGNSIGATASSPKIWVKQEFDANDLIAYPDHQITAINAWFTASVPTAVTVYVIKNGVIDYSQTIPADDVAAITLDAWTKFTLALPYKLEPGNKYAYGYYITHAKSVKPVGVDSSEAINNKGNVFSTSSPSSKGFEQSNPSWKTLASGGIAGNFMLTADVEACSEVPAAEDIAGYDVYADGSLLAADLTATTFSETVEQLGDKTYSVVAKSAGGKVSPAKEITLTYTLPAEYTAPQMLSTNFDAETGKVDLEWSNDAATLSHCGEAKYRVNFDEDLDIAWGAKFSASELSEISNYQIYEITFVPGATLTKNNLEVYAGKDLLWSYDISSYEPGYLYTLTLTTPVFIPEGKDLYLAYNASVPAGTSAFVIDAGPGVDGGAVVSYNNGSNWLAASALDPDMANYNFIISAKAKPASAAAAPAVTLGAEGVKAVTNGTIKMQHSEWGIEAGAAIKKAPARRAAAIKATEVEKFRVYRNGDVVAETTATAFSEVLSRYGEYVYAVTNVYANGWESPKGTEFYVENHIAQKPQAPYNLHGEAEGNSLTLTWEAIDAEAAVLKYHNGNYGYAVGMTSSSNEGYHAILFSSDSIATMNKAGDEITHVKFHLSSTELTYAAAVVIVGNNVVFEQNVDIADLVIGWNVVRLDTPFVIPAGFDVKIGYHLKYAKGIKPLSTDDGPAVAGFGDLISASTYSWYSLATKYSLNYNFMIEGICRRAAQTFMAPAQGKEEDADAAAMTYNLYHDGTLLASGITEQSYEIASAADGAYTVTAVVDGVESAESNAVNFVAGGSGINGIAAAQKARYDRNADAVILPEAADAQIYTAGGALVKAVSASSYIDMSNLASGAYVVKTAGAVIKVVK